MPFDVPRIDLSSGGNCLNLKVYAFSKMRSPELTLSLLVYSSVIKRHSEPGFKIQASLPACPSLRAMEAEGQGE
jgi:hypothetical protein